MGHLASTSDDQLLEYSWSTWLGNQSSAVGTGSREA
jgi:hypothetical protein